MLKDDLKRIIRNSTRIPEMQIEHIAQAIIDRLKIDEIEVKNLIIKNAYGSYTMVGYIVNEENLAKAIAKAKPIKLKEK